MSIWDDSCECLRRVKLTPTTSCCEDCGAVFDDTPEPPRNQPPGKWTKRPIAKTFGTDGSK